MPLTGSDLATYRQDVASKGSILGDRGRGDLIAPYLPEPIHKRSPPHSSSTSKTTSSSAGTMSLPPSQKARLKAVQDSQPRPTSSHSSTTTSRKPTTGHKKRLRPFLRHSLHFLLYFLIQLVYGITIRFYHSWHAVSDRLIAIMHYHHRTPEYIQRDVKDLSRVPEHLSVVLKYRAGEDNGLETLMDEVAELTAWSAAAGIPLLSVYEQSGVLKTYRAVLGQLVEQKLTTYFGKAGPTNRIFAANGNGSNGVSPGEATGTTMRNGGGSGSGGKLSHINVLLLSAADGRDTLVDLTRTLTEMAQAKKIRPRDITSDLINTEISATTAVPDGQVGKPQTAMAKKEVGAGEPDLVIIFGPYVKLDGYPPWQIRLSEIFCVGGDPSAGSVAVEYQGFLRGLWKFAGAEMRFGR